MELSYIPLSIFDRCHIIFVQLQRHYKARFDSTGRHCGFSRTHGQLPCCECQVRVIEQSRRWRRLLQILGSSPSLLASGARQVKHNKLQLSQTWGIIYLDPAQGVWLHFSNTLHFQVLVAPQRPSTSAPITPASLVSAVCGREQGQIKLSFLIFVFLHPPLFVPKHNLLCFIFQECLSSGDWKRLGIKPDRVESDLMTSLFSILDLKAVFECF